MTAHPLPQSRLPSVTLRRLPAGRRAVVLLGASVVVLGSSACESRITGNEGNFSFSYPADDDVADFNKPIAVGASLNIEVHEAGSSGAPIALTAADTDDNAVLAVTNFAGNEVIVTGVADGQVLLSVTGTDAEGEELSDSVNLLVRVPEVLKLWHTCDSTATTAAYLAGSRAYMPFDMEMSNGQAVIGYGYYPATSSDSAAFGLDLSASSQTHMAFDAGNTSAELTLDSDIDDTSLTVHVVSEADIDGVADPIAFVVEDIDVGEKNSFYVLPKVGEAKVCQANVTKTVVSDTPAICAVRDAVEEDDSLYEFGWFEIEGLAEGECLYTVTYPDGNGGAGASAQFSYPIQP